MSVGVERVIFEGVLTSNLLFVAETWSTTTREDSRIQSAEMYVLRAIMGKTRRDRQRNERIKEGVNAILNKMDAARLRWWGHLERMQEGEWQRRDGIRDRWKRDQEEDIGRDGKTQWRTH